MTSDNSYFLCARVPATGPSCCDALNGIYVVGKACSRLKPVFNAV